MDKVIHSLIATMNAQLPLMYTYMPGIQVTEEADWLGMQSCFDVFYNAVYEARFSPDNADKRVDEIVALFAERSKLPITWFLTPACKPTNLPGVLESKGFRLAFRTPGMFLDLDKFENTSRRDSPLEITQVSNVEQLSQWIIPGKEGFGLSDAVIEAYFEVFKSKGFDPQLPWKLFMGTVDGIPTTCVRLFCANGVAGIFHVATIPSERGHGYGTEITVAALEAAKKLGYKLAVLASSPAGYNVYRRLGFRDCCFCDVYIGPEWAC
jgi:GNAT superfamily N-acetyltransferase